MNKAPRNVQRAIRKYGEAICREAYRLNCEGYGAAGIANGTHIGNTCRTTNAADAAVNAGRYLVTGTTY